MWRVSTLDLKWVQVLALWKQQLCGTEKTNPRRHRKSGECQQGRHYCMTATLPHHECLQKSMKGGAPEAARDAIATRIETLKQAVYAKEPVHVQLVKVQAALTRAEEFAEKKHGAVWADREAADEADQHVLNLRQRLAELTERIYTEVGAHMAVGLWRVARCWWFLVWLALGSLRRWCTDPARWRDGNLWDRSGESQGCCVQAAARTVRRPGGLGSWAT